MVFRGRVAFLVEQHIGILVFLKLEVSLKRFIVAAEPILFNSFDVDFFNELVVKAIPFFFWVDEWKVMATVRCTWVNNCASQKIVKRLLRHIFAATKVIGSEFLHIKLHREVQVGIDFNFSHLVVVELKSLQHYNEDIGQLFYTEALLGSYFLLAQLTKIGIITI